MEKREERSRKREGRKRGLEMKRKAWMERTKEKGWKERKKRGGKNERKAMEKQFLNLINPLTEANV